MSPRKASKQFGPKVGALTPNRFEVESKFGRFHFSIDEPSFFPPYVHLSTRASVSALQAFEVIVVRAGCDLSGSCIVPKAGRAGLGQRGSQQNSKIHEFGRPSPSVAL